MSTQIPAQDKTLELLVYVSAVVVFLVGVLVTMGRYIFTRTTKDIQQLFDFHNKREIECGKHGERLAKLEGKIEGK